MEDLRLIINGKEAVLGSERSIDIDMTSPIFNDSGTYSYPFSIPFRPNRSLLGLLDEPDDSTNLKGLKLPFELYFKGRMILSGIARSDADTVDDEISLELGSGTKTMLDAFDDMNLRDLPVLSMNDYGTTEIPNGSGRPYYRESEYFTNYTKDYSEGYVSCSVNVMTSGTVTMYKYVSEGRPGSASRPTDEVIYEGGFRTVARFCPFINYIIDSIRNHVGYTTDRNDMAAVSFFNRLALLNTRIELEQHTDSAGKEKMLFSAKNFPDATISEFIEALSGMFGIRFINDETGSRFSVVLLRNILNNLDASGNPMPEKQLDITISAIEKIHLDPVYLKYTYGGDDNDTAFSCALSSHVSYVNGFGDLPAIDRTDDSDVTGDNIYIRPPRAGESRAPMAVFSTSTTNDYTRWTRSDIKKTDNLAIYDTTTYIAKNTGTRYRVKVNEEGQNPYYFEVDQFRDWTDQDYDEEFGQEVELAFRPVINNLCATSLAKNSTTVHYSDRPVFIDCEGTIQAVRQYECGLQLGILQLDELSMERDDVIGDYTPAFTADTMDLWGEDYNPRYADNFSLRLDADNSSEHIGVDASRLPGGTAVQTGQRYRGLIDNFHREYIAFMRNRRKVKLTVVCGIDALCDIDWTARYRIGDYRGLVDKVSYSISEKGIGMSTIELYLI